MINIVHFEHRLQKIFQIIQDKNFFLSKRLKYNANRSQDKSIACKLFSHI